ncbi:hypothetical protein CK203_029644 [Vitis vinifera]|uniref:Reverse transcriptase Ty1/copia-type domain-containing protein n=1 Tax=Vitis vinifera TaxID=29760 RepID=A0A438III4_VITVI|nr:hypothetical protein CK203_029644 [Vitis vinifera]
MISIKPKEEEVQHLDDKENAPQEQQHCLAIDRMRRQIKPPQRVLLDMVTLFDLELKQLDVKTVFSHDNRLKTQLQGEFEMKDLGAANKILGMEIHKNGESRKLYLSQKKYIEKSGHFTVQNLPPPVITRSSSLESPLSRRAVANQQATPYRWKPGCKPPPPPLCYDEDGGGLAIEGLDVENFGFPDAHFQSSFSNFQNE